MAGLRRRKVEPTAPEPENIQCSEIKESVMTRQWIQKTVALGAAAAILLTASTAWGEWGEGVQGGPFTLHPGVSLSAGFDSNIYYASERESTNLHQAPEGLVEPSLTINTTNPGAFNLGLDASVAWRQFFSNQEFVRGQSGLSAELDASIAWNEDGPFSLQLSENFVRSNETPNYASAQAINRIFNRAGIQAGLHPGGRILETYLSYDFSFYRHSRLTDLDRHTHHFGWNGHWAFLPKTAIVAEADYRMIRYDEAVRGGDRAVTPRLRNVNSNPLRLMGGVRGLLTPRITIGLRGGYGWGFYDDGPTFQDWLARAELSYQFGNVEYDNRLRVGYERDFRDSVISNFYTSHRAVAGYEQGFVANRLRLELEVDAQIRNYSETGIGSVQTESAEIIYPEQFSDLLLGVSAGTRFEIRNGWDVGVRYGFRSNFTEDEIQVVGVGEDSVRDYQRHHLMLSTQLRY